MATFNTEELKVINKVIDSVNKNKELGIKQATDPKGVIQQSLRKEQYLAGHKRTGKAHWIKIATIPIEVDEWFTKMYGPDYFKDKDFFEHYKEWKVVKGDTRNI